MPRLPSLPGMPHVPSRPDVVGLRSAAARGDMVGVKALVESGAARVSTSSVLAGDLKVVAERAKLSEALKGLKADLDAGRAVVAGAVPARAPSAVRTLAEDVAALDDLAAVLGAGWPAGAAGRADIGLAALARHADAPTVRAVRVHLAAAAAAGRDSGAARRLLADLPDEVLPARLRDIKAAATAPGGNTPVAPPVGPGAFPPEAAAGTRLVPDETFLAGLPDVAPAVKRSAARARVEASRRVEESIELQAHHLRVGIDRLADPAREGAASSDRPADGPAPDAAFGRIEPRPEPVEDRDVTYWGWLGVWTFGLGAALVAGVRLRTRGPLSDNAVWLLSLGAVLALLGVGLFWRGSRFGFEHLLAWGVCAGAVAAGVWGLIGALWQPAADGPNSAQAQQAERFQRAGLCPPAGPTGATAARWRARVTDRAVAVAVATAAAAFLVAVFPGWRERAAAEDLRDHALALARSHNYDAALARAGELPAADATTVRLVVTEAAFRVKRYDRAADTLEAVEREDPRHVCVAGVRKRLLDDLDRCYPTTDEQPPLTRLVESLARLDPADARAAGVRERLEFLR
jgi:hypothetical protein